MNTLNKKKLDQFRDMFLQKQQQIVLANASREDEIPMDGGDEIDIVQSNLLKSMVDKLSLRDKEVLNKIKEALQRLNDGTFGMCESCEEQIPEKRLVAIPYCTTCIDCAEAEERRSKQYRA